MRKNCFRIGASARLLGAAALLLATAVSAGADKIVFWHSQLSSVLIDSVCRDFTKKTGIAVEVNWIAHDDYKSSLIRHAREGGGPDIAYVPADFVGHDKELSFSEIPKSLNQGLVKNAANVGLFEGRMLGAPVTWGNHLLLFYNRDLVKTPAKSFEELERQAPAFHEKGVLPLGMAFKEMYWLVPFIGAHGGWPLDDKGQLSLNTPAVAKALAFYFDLAAKKLTEKTCHHECTLDRFIKGEFAYAIGGDWSVRDLQGKMGAKLGITLLPTIGKQPLTPMFSAYVMTFPAKSLQGKKKADLIRFAQYLQSAEVQRRWAAEAKLFPVNEKVFKEVTAHADEDLRSSLAQLKFARAMPNDRLMAFAWQGLSRGFSAIYSGRQNAQDAAATMQTYAEKMAKRDLAPE